MAEPMGIMMTENAAYALKHRRGIFNAEELISFSPERHFGLGLYLPLKALDGRPAEQKQLLEQLVNVLGKSGSYRATDVIRDYFFEHIRTSRDSHYRLKPEYKNLQIDGKSLGRLHIQDPAAIQAASYRVRYDVNRRDEKPVIKAYSGLVAIREFVHGMGPGDELLIAIPSFVSDDSTDIMGYHIIKGNMELGKFDIYDLLKSDDFSNSRLALIKFTDTKKQDPVELFFKSKGAQVSVESLQKRLTE